MPETADPQASQPLEKKPRLPWVALALALSSFVTCGMTAFPGLALSAVALRTRVRRRVAAAGLLISALGLLFALPTTSWHPDIVKCARVNIRMKLLGLPSIPWNSRRITVYSWSFLSSRYMLLRFDAPQSDVDGFFSRLGVSPVQRIGPGKNEVLVATYDEIEEQQAKATAAWENGQPSSFNPNRYHRPPSGYCKNYPWLCPQQIRKGKFYAGPVPNDDEALGLNVYHDEEKGTVFFCWTGD